MRSHPGQRNWPRYSSMVAVTLALLPTPTGIAFGLAKQAVLEEDLFFWECFLWNDIQHALDNRVKGRVTMASRGHPPTPW